MNLGIVVVLMRAYVAPWIEELDLYETSEEKLEAVRNSASDEGNEEIVQMCDWIESTGMTKTLFPEAK